MSKTHKKISLDITNDYCDLDIEKNISTSANNVVKNGLHFNSISLPNKKETNKKDVARRRWGLLAKALKSPISSQPSSPTDEISMRRFSTFMLLTTQLLEDDISKINSDIKEKNFYNKKQDEDKFQPKLKENKRRIQYKKQNWYRYSVEINNKNYFVDVPHTSRSFTAADLMGFNNTGNVCVWPSEESLAYYVIKNLEDFKGKTVLELGGGMSALAGLMSSKYGECKFVHLTDGNHLAVENVKSSLERNNFPDTLVVSSVLQWGVKNIKNLKDFTTFDIILSADCLFFDEARCDLIETIWECLDIEGVAYVMAPKRGDTLDIFVEHAKIRGFHCDILIVYDQNIWNRHLECLENPDYDANIHYPILILLTKSS